MKIPLSLVLSCLIFMAQSVVCATYSDIDPCSLLAPETLYAVYPEIQNLERQTIGPNTTCNYLNKYDLSALIVSVHKDDGISAEGVVSMLGDGYRVEKVKGLGREAAMAITLPKPEYGIAGDLVAELYVKKGDSCLMLAPARLNVNSVGSAFEQFKEIVLKMLESSSLP